MVRPGWAASTSLHLYLWLLRWSAKHETCVKFLRSQTVVHVCSHTHVTFGWGLTVWPRLHFRCQHSGKQQWRLFIQEFKHKNKNFVCICFSSQVCILFCYYYLMSNSGIDPPFAGLNLRLQLIFGKSWHLNLNQTWTECPGPKHVHVCSAHCVP